MTDYTYVLIKKVIENAEEITSTSKKLSNAKKAFKDVAEEQLAEEAGEKVLKEGAEEAAEKTAKEGCEDIASNEGRRAANTLTNAQKKKSTRWGHQPHTGMTLRAT